MSYYCITRVGESGYSYGYSFTMTVFGVVIVRMRIGYSEMRMIWITLY